MRRFFRLVQDALRVRPEEARRTSLAFLYLFTSIGAFITARIARTALFLEIPGYKKQLPLTYIGISICVSTLMYAYARFERKLRRDQTNTLSLAAIIVVTFLLRWALHAPAGPGVFLENSRHEVYWAFYLWVEVFGTLLIVQFWSLAGEVFHSRQGKRLFAVIGGGGVLANVAIGLFLKSSVESLGTENLLYVVCGLLAVSLVSVVFLGRDARAELIVAHDRPVAGKKKPSTGKASNRQGIFATRHVRFIATVVVLTYVVSTLADYQLNVVVGDTITGKDARSSFYASFFLYTGILAGIIQFTLTARILERYGVLFALVLLPSAMLGGAASMLIVPLGLLPALWAASFTKGSENTLRYTVNDSTLQLLYLPLPTALRSQAKAFIDGVLKPVSVGAAGLAMAVLVGQVEDLLREFFAIEFSLGFRLSVFDLSWLVVTGLAAWLFVLWLLKREYLASLMQTLQRRRLNFADSALQISDDSTLRTIEAALRSHDIGQVLHALELLPAVSRKARGTITPAVLQLTRHEAADVRVAALTYLAQQEGVPTAEVLSLLKDPSVSVRAAAVMATCASLHEQGVEQVLAVFGDDDQPADDKRVVASAMAGLIKYAGLDGVLACADILKRSLGSANAEDRGHAAWVLGEVGVQNFYQPLVPLLRDPSEKVRQAAIIAAGRLRSPALVESLLQQLERPRLAGHAVAALAGYGPQLLPTLTLLVDDTGKPAALRAQVCRVLARLGDAACADILIAHLSDDDVHVRVAVAQALAWITKHQRGIKLDRPRIDAALKQEALRCFENIALGIDLQVSDEAILLRDALRHRNNLAMTQILSLLALKYSHETIELVSRNLKSTQVAIRGNAVEVLDNLLSGEEKSFLIPLFDDATPEKTLQAGDAVFRIAHHSRLDRLKGLLTGADEWMKVCAALEVGDKKITVLIGEVEKLLESSSAVCRETALVALTKLDDKRALAAALELAKNDAAKIVSRYASAVQSQKPDKGGAAARDN